MTIKMIQNPENKMELQINNLETRIEKVQEMFNKNLEEIKKSQLKMNNAWRSLETIGRIKLKFRGRRVKPQTCENHTTPDYTEH